MEDYKGVKSVAFMQFARRSSERHGFAAYFYLTALYISEFSDHFYDHMYAKKGKRIHSFDDFVHQYNPQRFDPMLQSMLLRLYVEDFLIYLKDLIAVVFRAEPRTMASKESISLDAVVKSNSIEEVLQYTASQAMSRVSFFGFDELRSEMKRRGIKLELSDEEEKIIKQAVEKRNIIVHSGGYHSSLLGDGSSDLLPEITHENVRQLGDIIDTVVEKIDENVCHKFDLPSKGLAVDPMANGE
jgi:hypothetical protein